MVDTLGIYEHHSHNPQQNFSAGLTKQNPEATFAEQFALAYRERFRKIHSGTSKWKTLFVREVPVFGNGIADLLALSWSHDRTVQVSTCLNLEKLDPTVRAFEFKLSDWRKGLMQAHRYKYFSHASILVLPNYKIKSVQPQIHIFRKLRVGLWGFSPETGTITCCYTPRPIKQQIAKYGERAIRLAAQAMCSQFGSLLELSQAIQ
ncbi:MAG: hypothetical protein P8175_08500 [Deltaproteobacteria bacterium]|jgi:hypothetical protein